MSKFDKVCMLIIAVVGVGLGVGWWASRSPGSGRISNSNEVASVNPTPTPPPVTRPIQGSPKRVTDKTAPVVPMPKPQTVATNAPGLPGWEEKVDAILTADIPG